MPAFEDGFRDNFDHPYGNIDTWLGDPDFPGPYRLNPRTPSASTDSISNVLVPPIIDCLKRKQSIAFSGYNDHDDSIDSMMSSPTKRSRIAYEESESQSVVGDGGTSLDEVSNPASAPSLILALNPRTRLTAGGASTPTSKRARSPPRDLLLGLQGTVNCLQPESMEGNMPPAVQKLRQQLTKNLGSKVIPSGLKSRLRKKSPETFEDIPDYAFDDDTLWSTKRLKRIWKIVCDILDAARECNEYWQDESAWCYRVVWKVLTAAIACEWENDDDDSGDDEDGERDKCNMHSERKVTEPPVLQVHSVQTQALDSNLLPILPYNDKVISKKADFVLAFAHHHPSVAPLYNNLSFGGSHLALSQMLDPYTKRLALFAGLEVKPMGGDAKEAITQLLIWFSAGLNKQVYLRRLGQHNTSEDSGNNVDQPQVSAGGKPSMLPSIGWTVVGHDWKLYMAFKTDEGKTMVLGPFSALNTSTDSYYGVFTLLELIRRVSTYGREVYWPWLRREILEPLL